MAFTTLPTSTASTSRLSVRLLPLAIAPASPAAPPPSPEAPLRRHSVRLRWMLQWHLEQEERGLIRRGLTQQWQRNVIHRRALACTPIPLAIMGVPVKDRRHRVAHQRLLQPARAEKRE